LSINHIFRPKGLSLSTGWLKPIGLDARSKRAILLEDR